MSVVLLAHYQVSDPERLIAAFDGFEAQRRESGALARSLVRSLTDPGEIVAVIVFGSREEAVAFAARPDRATALREAGVTRTIDEFMETLRPMAAVAAA